MVKEASRNHISLEQTRAIRESAKRSIARTVGTPARRAELLRILTRWTLLDAQIGAVEEELAALVGRHPGAKALTTIPGVSTVCAATLVAEIGTLENFDSPRQVLKLAGMNMVRTQTGVTKNGRPRQTKRGRPLLRRQLFLLAGRWCQKRGLYRGYYDAMVARNQGAKISAICAVARKLVPMLLQVMQTAEPFDEARWRRAQGLPPREDVIIEKTAKRRGRASTAPASTPMDQEDEEASPYATL